MSRPFDPFGMPVSHLWCARCGERLVGSDRGEDPHEGCQRALELEPPRYCPACRRRMKVQVLPRGWSASCAEHGELTSE